MKEKRDFFISYNKADKNWAEWIAWHLEETGYTTMIQAWDFQPGDNFVLMMQRATSECERTIAVLSPDYLAAQFTQPEWAAALAQDPTGSKGTLLPVRVRECQIEGMLAQIVYVDLVGLSDKEEGEAVKRLISGAAHQRRKPKVPPGFPGTAMPRLVAERPNFPASTSYGAICKLLDQFEIVKNILADPDLRPGDCDRIVVHLSHAEQAYRDLDRFMSNADHDPALSRAADEFKSHRYKIKVWIQDLRSAVSEFRINCSPTSPRHQQRRETIYRLSLQAINGIREFEVLLPSNPG